ncbi:hypothetical protein DNTS_024582 [Danionella cerebrum]|uniref:Pentacotripeptide-repeat region of PRORP domain-containing protein n=1 Tax=Danionella cerebrum TaxID=2873325 RepID=A0A553NHF7_9TELE|nr:hypothetical protein DNTS_024582 [Danionella translucida]
MRTAVFVSSFSLSRSPAHFRFSMISIASANRPYQAAVELNSCPSTRWELRPVKSLHYGSAIAADPRPKPTEFTLGTCRTPIIYWDAFAGNQAKAMLEDIAGKHRVHDLSTLRLLRRTLDRIADKGLSTVVEQLLDAIITMKLCHPGNFIFLPLINSYINNKDYEGAVLAIKKFNAKYKIVTGVHELFSHLLEEGDLDVLQEGVLHITVDLEGNPIPIFWFAKWCVRNTKMEALENLVELTKNLRCDRFELYHQLICLCEITNDWEKAESVWMKIQEESLIAKDKTLFKLANILQSNGKEVPFEVPEVNELTSGPDVLDLVEKAQQSGNVLPSITYEEILLRILQLNRAEDALRVQKIAFDHYPALSSNVHLTCKLAAAYVENGWTRDAFGLLESVLEGQKPPPSHVLGYVAEKLARRKDFDGLHKFMEILKKANYHHGNLSSYEALAHFQAGDLDRSMTLLESLLSNPATADRSVRPFIRNTIKDITPDVLEKLMDLAQKLSTHFNQHRLAIELFQAFLLNNQIEDLKNLITPAAITAITEMIPDALPKKFIYGCLIRGYVDDNFSSSSLLSDSSSATSISITFSEVSTLSSSKKPAGASCICCFRDSLALAIYGRKLCIDKDLKSAKEVYQRALEENLHIRPSFLMNKTYLDQDVLQNEIKELESPPLQQDVKK